MRELARGRRVVPVGRVAHEALGGTYVRHPAHGGAAEFRRGLRGAARGDAGAGATRSLLAAGLVCLSGMVQLAVALGTVTLVAVTGLEGILGLGPAVFLIAGALAVGPAGRISDRVGRMPVIRAGFVLGMVGPAITALGCWSSSGELVFLGLAFCGAAQAIVMLSRAAAAEMFPPERRARGMSFVLFGAVSGAIFGPLDLRPDLRRPRR